MIQAGNTRPGGAAAALLPGASVAVQAVVTVAATLRFRFLGQAASLLAALQLSLISVYGLLKGRQHLCLRTRSKENPFPLLPYSATLYSSRLRTLST